MVVCPECSRENDINNRYCGYCGTGLVTSDIVVDGKKNKRQLNFINTLLESNSRNILYILACTVAFLLVALFLLFFFGEFENMTFGLGYHINQIAVKYPYILEGVALDYIAPSLNFVLKAISFFIFGAALLFDIPVTIFYIVFGCYIFCYRRKNNLYMKKPVALIRLKMMITKYSLLVNIIIICLLAAIFFVRVYIGGI